MTEYNLINVAMDRTTASNSMELCWYAIFPINWNAVDLRKKQMNIHLKNLKENIVIYRIAVWRFAVLSLLETKQRQQEADTSVQMVREIQIREEWFWTLPMLALNYNSTVLINNHYSFKRGKGEWFDENHAASPEIVLVTRQVHTLLTLWLVSIVPCPCFDFF